MQGKVAEQNLALQQQQADRDQAQRELINQNNSYATKVSYRPVYKPTGLIGRA
jgi:hypothetical protein